MLMAFAACAGASRDEALPRTSWSSSAYPHSGWRCFRRLVPVLRLPYELDSILSAEDTELLQALMNAGHADRMEFMG